jgi:hypothetical protein
VLDLRLDGRDVLTLVDIYATMPAWPDERPA